MNPVDFTTAPSAGPWRAVRLLAASSLLWWILAGNAGWPFGIVVIAVATAAGLLAGAARVPAPGPIAVLRFAAYFVKNSFLGSVDVAYRAVHPRLPLKSAWVEYPLRLPPGSPRTLFVNAMNLMPGTLCADLKDDVVIVHLLQDQGENTAELIALEQHVAALFSLSLENRRG